MEKQKRSLGAGLLPGRSYRPVPRPYTLRVKRDHGGGLWTFEDDQGQLYLAVKSREFMPVDHPSQVPMGHSGPGRSTRRDDSRVLDLAG